MQAFLVQPPFVQLNAPYPAIHYLESWLKAQGIAATSFDHSIELYRALFSRKGLETVFAGIESRPRPKASKGGDAADREIARYLSYKPSYLEWIDGLVDFLCGGDPGFAHRLAAAAESPRGARARAFVEAAGGRIRSVEARNLATLILEDLADLIRFALDPDFGTVRYGERIAASLGDFGEVTANLERAWFIQSFYLPWLRGFWSARAAEMAGATGEASSDARGGAELGAEGASPPLVLITIPFPGCLAGALACAQAAREVLGKKAVIVFGGGYVSTELRTLADPRLFDWCDYLSFDAGFGSLASIIAREGAGGQAQPAEEGLYRTMRRVGGRVVKEGFGDGSSVWKTLERAALETTFPDYSCADFTRYLRAVDSGNPMHRLWSDTPWLKFSLAHGCYWHRCSFCDTELDYVANFVPAGVEALMVAAVQASARHGLYGIHFVDEALPMPGLLSFAKANRARMTRGERPFSFWGNVRFDASWTADRCEYLAASGLVAVSGGIEIATERGLEMTNKGFDLAALVKTLVGMRRAGLLVHAYLIYGFPGQDGADIVESAEVTRQLFETGLVDSAFWHRFVLTRASRMMAHHREGRMPLLVPKDRGGKFASNDLGFEGEASYDVFDGPLVAALEAWMRGEGIDAPIQSWFEAGRKAFKPASADPGLMESLIAKAEAALDGALDAGLPPSLSQAHWVAGLPLLLEAKKPRLSWAYRGELVSIEGEASMLALLKSAIDLASGTAGADRHALAAALGPAVDRLGELRGAGLVFI